MKTSLFKYLIASIIIVGSLIIAAGEVNACGNVTLTAKPPCILAEKNVTSRIVARVIGPDGKPATGTITFSVIESPSSSDKFSNKGTVKISNGIANITFYHYRSNPGIISISAIATITVKAQDGSLQTFNPTGYIVIYALSVEFLKSGTNSVISKAHVGTDGDPATTKDGETKQFDIKILPEDCKLQFVLSNQEADISPKEGKGTITVTLTGKGSGYSDSEFSVQGGNPPNIVAKLPIKIHKPDKVVFASSRSVPITPGYIGVDKVYLYNVKDVRNRTISDIGGYRVYERLHIDMNQDGLGGPFAYDIIQELKCKPYPGYVFSPGISVIPDEIALSVPDGTTTKELSKNAIFQFHNSFYLIDIYLKGSTNQYTFKPQIKREIVKSIKFNRKPLNDSQKVTESNDDIGH